MTLRFYGKGGSEQEECPAVFVDEETLDLVLVGVRVEDPQTVSEIKKYTDVYGNEGAFRLPRKLRKALWEALGGPDPDFG
ncbi:hypothetical protein [Bailinhaonella thermotolerans]|uniref:Uncharacterized protein n=1 Tax=Bailinhaonella thermotolerans TaxID=1070861 RepID=A0A3A4B9S3_9ACTN|nr:hypothetical protein [Bailinhaonella thermotolerans]RJL35639.1 hypothetical protein D5H75_02295 [Bailinhaonella thermotolerans]